MNIRETVFNLQKVFEEMEQNFNAFQSEAKLPRLPGCGKCCTTPDIESSILESLPWALKIYREGKFDEWILRLEKEGARCALWEGDPVSGKGKCISYETRPAVCRMFGVSGTFDKNQKVTVSSCKEIKNHYPEKLAQVSQGRTTQNTPMIPFWYGRIQSLGDQNLLARLPINHAMLEALQLIGFHSQYHENN